MQNRYAFDVLGCKCLRIKLAEGVRFELTRPFGLPVFKTGAINRSATPPACPQGGLQPHSYEKDARPYFGISARVSKCDRGLSSPFGGQRSDLFPIGTVPAEKLLQP